MTQPLPRRAYFTEAFLEMLKGDIEIVGEAYGCRCPSGQFDVRLPDGTIWPGIEGRHLEQET